LKRWVWLGGACAVVAAPWYLRNWLLLGNPIYPLGSTGPFWDAYRARQLMPPSDLYSLPLRLLRLPWDISILGTQSTSAFDATIGPWFLLLIPLLLFVWRRGERVSLSALLFAGALWVFWLLELIQSPIAFQTRYIFFIFPVLALLSALALARLPSLDRPQFSAARFVYLVVPLVLALTLWNQLATFAAPNPIPYLTGEQSRTEYLQTHLDPPGYYAALQFVNGLGPQSKVLFLWEPRDYYAARTVTTQSDWILDTFGHLRYLYHDAATIAATLRDQGYTHVLIARWGLSFQLEDRSSGMTIDDLRALQELTSHYAKQVYGMQSLDYSISPSGQAELSDPERAPYAIYQLTSETSAARKP